jgi:hypothetical protein
MIVFVSNCVHFHPSIIFILYDAHKYHKLNIQFVVEFIFIFSRSHEYYLASYQVIYYTVLA